MDKPIFVERIVPQPLSARDIALAEAGIWPTEEISLDEFRQLYAAPAIREAFMKPTS